MRLNGSAWATDLPQVVSSEPDVTLHGHTPYFAQYLGAREETSSGQYQVR